MSSQILEQILEFSPGLENIKTHSTIDVYASGTTILYTPPPKPFNFHGPAPIGNVIDDPFRRKDDLNLIEQKPYYTPTKADFEIKKKGFVDFTPASELGIGPGIARELPGTSGLIERYRYGNHEPWDSHLNYENILPGKERKPILDNHHIIGLPKLEK